jgi:hypothetical protein
MKIVSISLGRAVWIFDLARVNSKGRSLLDTIHALGARYRFAKFPQHLMDLNKEQALEFNSGTFIKDGIDFRVGLTIYNNGIAADSFSYTENSEAFLEDVAAWLSSERGIDIKSELKRNGYVSHLQVQAKSSLPLWNPKLDFVPSAVSALATSMDGKPRQYAMDGILLAPTDAGVPMAPLQFQLDRKWGTDSNENIYYSQAAMGTQDHLALLNKIEAVLLDTTS